MQLLGSNVLFKKFSPMYVSLKLVFMNHLPPSLPSPLSPCKRKNTCFWFKQKNFRTSYSSCISYNKALMNYRNHHNWNFFFFFTKALFMYRYNFKGNKSCKIYVMEKFYLLFPLSCQLLVTV